MSPDTFSDTRLPWYKVIMRPHVVWTAPSKLEPPAPPFTEPKTAEESWVTEAICEYYND